MMPKPLTYRDLGKWLKTLNEAQLSAPILLTTGADDFGGTDYLPVVDLVGIANEHPLISGGYQGPALLVKVEAVPVREREE
jgi:hypothetical protein